MCSPVRLHCPAPGHTFPARACCSALWLHLGAPVKLGWVDLYLYLYLYLYCTCTCTVYPHCAQVGLGNECTVDMADMEASCPMYDCYKNNTVSYCSYTRDLITLNTAYFMFCQF